MLREIRDLGFQFAELSHGIRISLLPGILEAVDSGEIKISSLHNFCPLPMGVNNAAPNLFQFSAERPRERELAHRYTLKSFDLATRVKAPAVVLHLGSIEIKNHTDKLLEMVARGERDSDRYKKICANLDEKREARKSPFLDRVKEELKKLIPEAEARGLKLGLENRQAVEELPFESDFQFIFRELTSPALVYWHDTGHAQIKENLGFIQHAMHLESLRAKLFGLHVHDVQFPGRDHCAPGSGTTNFTALKQMIGGQHIKVFEFGPSMPPDELRRGIEHIRTLWGNE